MTNISDYFRKLQNFVEDLTNVEIEKYEEQIFTDKKGNWRIRLRFSDNSLLEASEAIQITGKNFHWLSYRYHYKDYKGNLIFRYGNAPHHPEAKTHPHHKHLFDKVIDSLKPELELVFKEIKKHL